MNEKFEDLNAAALSLADEELTHIAESEQLTELQCSRITANALQKAGLAPVQKPSPRKKRIRIMSVLLAAAVSSAVLGLGVSGWMTYNRQQSVAYFGEIGTAQIEEYELYEPQSFTNGIVRVNVTAVLSDGEKALALLTFEPADKKQKINWDLTMENLHEKGVTDNSIHTATPQCGSMQNMRDGSLWMTMWVDIYDLSEQDSVTFCYEKQETDFPSEEELEAYQGDPGDLYERPEQVGHHEKYFNEWTDGLEFTLPLTPNVDVVTFTAGDGDSMRLSAFGLYADRAYIAPFDPTEMSVTYQDGTQAAVHIPSFMVSAGSLENGEKFGKTYAKLYGEVEGMAFDESDPASYCGLIDVADIAEIEYGGRVYLPAE